MFLKRREEIEEALQERILILDGAMGTQLQDCALEEDDFRGEVFGGWGCELKGNNDCLCLTRPQVILDIHRRYIAAGADIITTNSFSSNRISQSEYGCADFAAQMARAAARLARQAADEAMGDGLSAAAVVASGLSFGVASGAVGVDVSFATAACAAAAGACLSSGVASGASGADPSSSGVAGQGRRIWVAGDVGPTGKSLSLASDLADPAYRRYDFDDMVQAYKEQIEALVEGGVDLILFETCFDALNVKAGMYAIEQLGLDIPVMVSVSVGDRSGRTLTGQTLEAFYLSVCHGNLLSFGLNCSLGARDLEPLLADVASFARCRVSCHPNAGLPDEMGRYNETPEMMVESILRMARSGYLNIVGGCCGTTPAHIRAIAEALRRPDDPISTQDSEYSGHPCGIAPRPLPEAENTLSVSGLSAVSLDTRKCNFTNIGERTNVAGSRKFAKLIAAGEYDQALQVAAHQIEGGAAVIDVNMDDAMLDSKAEMRKFLRYISNDPAVASASLMIDSSHWETIVEGLKNAQGKCIVNSISLKEGEEIFLEHARFIRSLGAAVVVMAFDEQGQATTYERKIEICARAYDLLTRKAGFAPYNIIFDVNVLSVGTGLAEHRRYGIDFIEAVRWIKQNLPGALTSGGISNLSFAFRGNNPVREAMHSAFLYHARNAGLDMGIVNPSMLQIYDDIEPEMLQRVEDVILDRDEEATDRLIAKAQQVAEAVSAAKQAATALVSPGSDGASAGNPFASSAGARERLVQALVKGKGDSLREDVMEMLAELGEAVDVIEGPLMDGMKRVGEYFGDGRMFLPQVIKSAKIMRDAVEILKPYMESSGDASALARPKVVIATVKGDVHDIGKNITAIVLSCNGFDVTDLGVMVPKETILAKAEEIKADFIAVSGLITPSLYQMEELCREMSSRGMATPLFVGGATASALHTAVKLAPLYEHVYYGSDASDSAVKFKSYMIDAEAFEVEQHVIQQKLRQQYSAASAARSASVAPTALTEAPSDSSTASTVTTPEVSATSSAPTLGFSAETFLRGKVFSDFPVGEISPKELLPYFDWKMFNAVWGIKTEDSSLRADAEHMLRHLIDENALHVRLGLHFEMARSERDADGLDWIVTETGHRLPMLRQTSGKRLSLADFLPFDESAFPSQLGYFAVAVTSDSGHDSCNCPECKMDYEPMLLRSIKVTLAEAASSWVDARLKAELRSSDEFDAANRALKDKVKIVKPAAGYSSCPDHSLKADIIAAIPDSEQLGIGFTETFAMTPDASICAFVFAHPDASYPDIRELPDHMLKLYAAARHFTEEQSRIFLGHLCAGSGE